jgi:hypothetical protein
VSYRISAETARHRGRVAALARAVRHGERPANDPELIAARRDLAYEQLAEHVRKVVDAAPPATADQLARIGTILQAGAA